MFLDKIKKCDQCPLVKAEHTPGTGNGSDYYCTRKNNKKIAGYVEWDNEMPPVPEWCPFKVEEKVFKTAVELAGGKLKALLLTDEDKEVRKYAEKKL